MLIEWLEAVLGGLTAMYSVCIVCIFPAQVFVKV